MSKKKQILMLIESSTSYGRDILRGIARYASERNDWEFTVQPRGMADPLPSLRRWNGDGVISRLSDRRSFEAVASLKCPTVELLFDEQVPVFGSDDAIAAMALSHFARLGFQNVGFFSFGGCFWIRHRRESFLRECRSRQIVPDVFEPPCSRRDRRPEPFWNDRYEKPLTDWLNSLRLPSAILCANDHQAVWLMNACREIGLTVPDDAAILGVNNDEHLCEIITPTLSSIDQNAERIGYEAARLLDKKINGESTDDYPKRIEPKSLAERGSTDAFPADQPEMVRVVRHIREFASTGLRVADLLDEFQLSNKTLERWFKNRFGHTPEREIILTRLRRAVELLESTNETAASVAELSGFSSERYFVQVFRREIGLTPHRFRLEKNRRKD